jgi:hypothetical protein
MMGIGAAEQAAVTVCWQQERVAPAKKQALP